jgi:hypothetical protein
MLIKTLNKVAHNSKRVSILEESLVPHSPNLFPELRDKFVILFLLKRSIKSLSHVS